MTRLLKTRVKQRADEIKTLILSGKPFEEQLSGLYTDLRLGAKHAWAVELYRLLLLYVPEEEKSRLLHPALLQAFISTGHAALARQTAQTLLRQNPRAPETRKLLAGLESRAENTLVPYTPLAALSPYADGKTQRKKSVLRRLPPAWEQAAKALTPQKLEETGYYAKKAQLARTPKLYRAALERTFDELTFNHLFRNYRAEGVLAGAMLEMLLAVHFRHKLKLKNLSAPGKPARDVFDLSLNDLLAEAARRALLPGRTLRLCRAARVQRNFIHPGKEILEQNGVTPAGARVCFLAVLETMDALL